jgi:hypothetical protein
VDWAILLGSEDPFCLVQRANRARSPAMGSACRRKKEHAVFEKYYFLNVLKLQGPILLPTGKRWLWYSRFFGVFELRPPRASEHTSSMLAMKCTEPRSGRPFCIIVGGIKPRGRGTYQGLRRRSAPQPLPSQVQVDWRGQLYTSPTRHLSGA